MRGLFLSVRDMLDEKFLQVHLNHVIVPLLYYLNSVILIGMGISSSPCY